MSPRLPFLSRCPLAALAVAVLVVACTGERRRQAGPDEAAREDIRRGALEQALTRVAAAEAEARTPPETTWRLRLLRAEALLLRRDAAGALAVLDGLSVDKSPAPALTARRTYLLGLAALVQGRLTDAAAALDEARQQARQSGAEDTALDADALAGQILMRSGRWEEADALLRDVATRGAARQDRYHEAVALLNQGMGRVVRNRYDEALPFFERVLEHAELQRYTVYANALTNAGLSYARLGQFDRAIDVQRRAVASHEERGVPVYLEQSLGELGTTHFLAGDPRQALTYLTRAFDVATRAGLTADAALWAGNIATTSIQLGQFDRAEDLNRQAVALWKQTNGNTLENDLNAAHIAAGRGDGQRARVLYEQILRSGGDPSLQWEAHAGLARVALAGGDRTAAVRQFDSALQQVEQARAGLQAAEHRVAFLARVIQFYQDYVDTLVAMGRPERALEVADSSRAVVLAERMGRSALPRSRAARHFVAAARRAKSVWLSYWLARDRSYVWVVTPGGVQVATLPRSAEIERVAGDYRALVDGGADPLAAPHSAGDALYSMVVAPVARFIPRGSNVRLVPDGALHSVNFETLPMTDGGRRRYWIEDVTLAVAPSLALLADRHADVPERQGRSLLLVGDPTPRPPEYPRLGYAPVEMDGVSRHFERSRIARFDGDRASPANYFAARPEGFSVIHFAAHAAANRISPLDSAVILAGSPDTGKLYARDVAERPLNASLVTISACRSAGERMYAGEGLVGFAWAFMRAGASQVIAGLWDVDDQSTATLMETLYEGIARGDAAPAALRRAKLTLLSRGGNTARPYYWGPFEVFTVRP